MLLIGVAVFYVQKRNILPYAGQGPRRTFVGRCCAKMSVSLKGGGTSQPTFGKWVAIMQLRKIDAASLHPRPKPATFYSSLVSLW